MMKKLLYISVLLLVSSSLSCKSWFSPEKPKTSESGVSASDFLRDQFQQQPVVMPPAETVPTNIMPPTTREYPITKRSRP